MELRSRFPDTQRRNTEKESNTDNESRRQQSIFKTTQENRQRRALVRRRISENYDLQTLENWTEWIWTKLDLFLALIYEVIVITSILLMIAVSLFVSWPYNQFETHRPYSIKPLGDVDRSLIFSPFVYRLNYLDANVFGDVPKELIFPEDHRPEGLHSIAVDNENNVVYIAGKNNTIYSIDNKSDKMKFVKRFCDIGECDSPSIVFFNGSLYLSSSDLGVISYNPTTGYIDMITYPQQIEDEPDNETPLMKEMSIAPNGKMYWIDYSLAHEYYSDAYPFETFYMDPYGRLVEYDPEERKHRVLMKDLAMPGGIQVSEDGSYILVVETLAARIRIYYLEGMWKGRSEMYLEGLPGLPYGIHTDGEDGYIVSLHTVISKHRQEPWLPHVWAENGFKRGTLFRVMYYSRTFLSNMFEPFRYFFSLVHKVLYEFYTIPFFNEGSMVMKVKTIKNDYGFDEGEIVEEERFLANSEAGGVLNMIRHGSYFYTTTFGGKTVIRHKASDNSTLRVSRCRIPRDMMDFDSSRTKSQLIRARSRIQRKPLNPIDFDTDLFIDKEMVEPL